MFLEDILLHDCTGLCPLFKIRFRLYIVHYLISNRCTHWHFAYWKKWMKYRVSSYLYFFRGNTMQNVIDRATNKMHIYIKRLVNINLSTCQILTEHVSHLLHENLFLSCNGMILQPLFKYLCWHVVEVVNRTRTRFHVSDKCHIEILKWVGVNTKFIIWQLVIL